MGEAPDDWAATNFVPLFKGEDTRRSLETIDLSLTLVMGQLLKEVTKKTDEGRVVDVVYVDFTKAYDKVPHDRLISKVRSHGIPDRLVKNMVGKLAFIAQTFEYRSWDYMLKLYRTV
eukprot:g29165.t1